MSQDPRDPGYYRPEPRRPQDPGWEEPTRPLDAPGAHQYPSSSPRSEGFDPFRPHLPHQPDPLGQPYLSYPPAAAHWSWAPPPEQRSAKGTVSLCLAITALLISCILSWTGGMAMARFMMMDDGSWEEDADYQTLDPTASTELMRSTYALLGQLVPTAVGIAALVVGILACQHRSSRGTGIGAIIISVLAPMVSCFVFLMAMLPVLAS